MDLFLKYWVLIALFFGFLLISWCVNFFFREKPFVGIKEPFTDCEIHFFRALEKACKAKRLNLRVMGKMRVADLIEMNPKLKGKDFWKHFKKISQTHVDYSLLDHDFKLVAVVELDDNSHDDRAKADQLKDDVFDAVGLPLIRFKPKYQYDLNVIAQELKIGMESL